jgi:hypothetical protein
MRERRKSDKEKTRVKKQEGTEIRVVFISTLSRGLGRGENLKSGPREETVRGTSLIGCQTTEKAGAGVGLLGLSHPDAGTFSWKGTRTLPKKTHCITNSEKKKSRLPQTIDSIHFYD